MASILPLTDGKLKIKIDDELGQPITVATSAVGNVFTPKRKHVGVDQDFTYHSGDQRWVMPILAAWSADDDGKPVRGEYLCRLEFHAMGKKLTDNIRYNVDFTDKS